MTPPMQKPCLSCYLSSFRLEYSVLLQIRCLHVVGLYRLDHVFLDPQSAYEI